MEEKDSDYFFGRARETVEVLNALAAPDRLPVLIGNSGVGKSSLAQAGVLAALKRQAWPEEAGAPNAWPAVFQDSRQWCFLSLKPGTDPLKALVECFLDTWQFAATDPERVKHQHGWIELLHGKATLSDLIEATERRRKELDQPKPPSFFLYIDQGEELYVRAEERQRGRFSELIAQALPDPRLRTMMSLRSDFLGSLQSDEPLFKARQQIDVPPLREAALREVVSRPAQLLGGAVRDRAPRRHHHPANRGGFRQGRGRLAASVLHARRHVDTYGESADDGTLRLPAQSFELGGVLVDRADKFLAAHPSAEQTLRRVLTLKLATVRDDGEPTRRRAARAEFSDDEWRLVIGAFDYPNRLLVTATTETGETYAEVAHEAIFRRWNKLREWITAEREFLIWRSGLEAANRSWQATPNSSKRAALLMGFALTQARRWLEKRGADLPTADRSFILLSQKAARQRRTQFEALISVLVFAVIATVFGWFNNSYLQEQWRWYVVTRPYVISEIRPYVLTTAAEHALVRGQSFKECASSCSEMIVVPAGSFTMGTHATENGHGSSEDPPHNVTIAKAFAVSKYELTFADWDACSSNGDCDPRIDDNGFGRGRQPVINVTWDDAKRYAAWLAKVTGKPYRLLSEAEYEYAARAGTETAFPWGDDIGVGNANCNDCGSQWDFKQPAQVGSFPPNGFGLYDTIGNVDVWVEDCDHPDYNGAPDDGSAWIQGGNCGYRMVRGGSWLEAPKSLRSGHRDLQATGFRFSNYGIRIGRTINP